MDNKILVFRYYYCEDTYFDLYSLVIIKSLMWEKLSYNSISSQYIISIFLEPQVLKHPKVIFITISHCTAKIEVCDLFPRF